MFTALITEGISKCGNQENLAIRLDLSPSALSKRINGETGWHDKDINKMLEITGHIIIDCKVQNEKIETLKKTIKILSEGI